MDVLRALVRHLEFYDNVLKQSCTWKFLKQRVEMFFTTKIINLPSDSTDGGRTTVLITTLKTLHCKLSTPGPCENNDKNNDNSNNDNNTNNNNNNNIDPDSVQQLLSSLDTCVKATFKDVIKFLAQCKSKKNDHMDVKVVKSVYEVILRGLGTSEDLCIRLMSFVSVLEAVKDLIP